MAGCEAAIHTLTDIFETEECEAMLFVDASNVFNSISRKVALQNIQRIFPLLAPMIINTYRTPSCLFIDGESIMSREGVTQGDPLAMAFYAIATTTLIEKLRQDTLQVWYADDAAGAGKLSHLRAWWDKINELGPAFGYFPNATKSHILVKENLLCEARETFEGTNLQIDTNGMGYLGGSIGSEQFTKDFIAGQVQEWIRNVEALFEIAQCHPQAALAVLTHGLAGKWTYLMRVTSGDKDFRNQLESSIATQIPTCTNRQAGFQ